MNKYIYLKLLFTVYWMPIKARPIVTEVKLRLGYQCNYGSVIWPTVKNKKETQYLEEKKCVKKRAIEIERNKRDEQQRKRDDKNKWWLEKNRQSPLNRGAKKVSLP